MEDKDRKDQLCERIDSMPEDEVRRKLKQIYNRYVYLVGQVEEDGTNRIVIKKIGEDGTLRAKQEVIDFLNK